MTNRSKWPPIYVACLLAAAALLGIFGPGSSVQTHSAHAAALNDEIPNVAKPRNLKATLRPYQKEGFNWLVFLHEIPQPDNKRIVDDLPEPVPLRHVNQALAEPAHAVRHIRTVRFYRVVRDTSPQARRRGRRYGAVLGSPAEFRFSVSVSVTSASPTCSAEM